MPEPPITKTGLLAPAERRRRGLLPRRVVNPTLEYDLRSRLESLVCVELGPVDELLTIAVESTSPLLTSPELPGADDPPLTYLAKLEIRRPGSHLSLDVAIDTDHPTLQILPHDQFLVLGWPLRRYDDPSGFMAASNAVILDSAGAVVRQLKLSGYLRRTDRLGRIWVGQSDQESTMGSMRTNGPLYALNAGGDVVHARECFTGTGQFDVSWVNVINVAERVWVKVPSWDETARNLLAIGSGGEVEVVDAVLPYGRAFAVFEPWLLTWTTASELWLTRIGDARCVKVRLDPLPDGRMIGRGPRLYGIFEGFVGAIDVRDVADCYWQAK